jgi:transcriptional regulator with XRE-family HTH domain
MNIQQNSATSAQIRSARALLGWSQKELARRAKLGTSTVADFERGARHATQNNVQSMIDALKAGGVEFTEDSVARRAIGPSPSRPVAGRTPFRWIEIADLEDWANRRNAQEVLPELICRLIRADRGLAAELRIPSGDGISMKGWDGQCRVETIDSTYVPAGTSGWEMSVQKADISGKATEAYQARTSAPGRLDPRQSTFVFVTARRWEGKDKWIKEAKESGQWKDVRVYDTIDLVHWLEAFPSVTSWLAGIIGKRPPGLMELETAWKEWSLATERPIVPALVLAGRDEEAMRCLKWAEDPPSPLALQAESGAEATAFVYAAITQLPANEHTAFLTRCLVVKQAEQARSLGQSLTALYLILEDADAGLVRWLVGQGHHVCTVFGSEVGVPPDVIPLPHISRADAEPVLVAMGYEKDKGEEKDKARNIARDIGGSLSVFRRLYPSVPERALPQWAQRQNADSILPAFFAGAWDENSDGDKDVLQQLAGKPYEEFEKGLAQWAALPDSPLRKSGSVWKMASPRDALLRLAPLISSGDMKKFSQTAIKVLGTADPRFSISPEERWLAPIRGKMPSHSPYLRIGLGETLLVLALFGERAGVRASRAMAGKVVRDLLHGADALRWWSLSNEMRFLSEAAPEEFLAALRDSLEKNDPPVMELFKEDGGGLFPGGAHHSDLLWAMEGLAWDPKYLAEVALLLARMARLDPPGGRYANRPLSSLRNIFVWWLPQTCADFAERMQVIDLIRRDDPGVAWKLMLALLPGNYETLIPSSKPRWREIPPELPEQTSTRTLLREAETLADKLLADIGSDAERWVALVERFPQLPKQHLERAAAELRARAPSFDHKGRNALWAALRELLSKHREFADADWALPEELLAPLDAVYAAFTPNDRIERVAWLFNEGRGVALPEKLEGGWEAYEATSEVRRREAISELWRDAGSEGIERLAQAVPNPWLVGFALVESDLAPAEKEAVFIRSLQADDDKLEGFARGFVGKRLEIDKAAAEDWAYALLDRAAKESWPRRSILAILIVMPPSRKLWERVEQFGKDISDAYWKQLSPYRVPQTREDIAITIERLMQQNRAADLLSLVSRQPEGIASATLVQILRDAIHVFDKEPHSNDVQMFQYHLEKILTEFDRRGDVDVKTIAQLEWQYLPLMRHSKRSSKTLHRSLSETPSFFVEVLKAIYRAKTETEVSAETTEDDPLKRQMVRQAYELLQSWHRVPGMENGVIDAAKLEAWVAETRRLADEADRIGPCDVYIGKLLAYAPKGEDGIWPHEAVRGIIETSRSEVIERNIASGILDRRGVTMRNPGDGGEQEWSLAKQYRDWSEALRFKSPRTSAALEGVAKMFEDFARRHDEDTERSNWQ